MFMRSTPPPVYAETDGERRITCRYAAAKSPVEIGRWVGSEFKITEMALRDVSLSGASGVAETPPPDSATIWMRLNDPAHPDWVEATVIAVTSQRRSPSLVRMKFCESCPYEFFKAAIRGIDPPGESERYARTGLSTYWSGHYWD